MANVLRLLTAQWVVIVVALGLAVGALVRNRRLARRVERLTETYWELRYETGQLRAQVARLESAAVPPDPNLPRQTATGAFVPLSSLKR